MEAQRCITRIVLSFSMGRAVGNVYPYTFFLALDGETSSFCSNDRRLRSMFAIRP
jgi:hypothetical protein